MCSSTAKKKIRGGYEESKMTDHKAKEIGSFKHKDLTAAGGCVNCATLEGGRTEVVISYRQNRQHHTHGIPSLPSPPLPPKKKKKTL